jgi:ABC-type antimicrobial peptide transport system permease subunit
MAFISLIVAVALVWILLPAFNEVTGKTLILEFSNDFVLILISILIITGLLAGSYPALYLSSFKPIKVLKGQSPNSWRELFLRKGLVVFQFSLSIILIVSVLVVYKQIEFTQKADIGFDKDNIIYFEAEGELESKLQIFLDEVRRVPGVKMASSTAHSFIEEGYRGDIYGLDWEGKNPETVLAFEYMPVNYDLVETLDFKIVAGRSFERQYKTDEGKLILNEAAVKAMGFKDPLAETVSLFGVDRQVLGVVKDFNFRSFREVVGPAFFILNPADTWVAMIKLQTGTEVETIKSLQKIYAELNPGFSFDYKFLSQDYAKQYAAEQQIATLSRAFAVVAILISCLGLFGLAAFSAERRQKEIGIRKILGSSTSNIIRLLSADFTKMVLISIFIGVPISYFIAVDWLQGFAYSVGLKWWFFALAGVSALLIAWITVGFQTLKASRVNPVDCLKNE